MRLEAVDKRNPMLIRVATIAEVEDHRLKVQCEGGKEGDMLGSCIMNLGLSSLLLSPLLLFSPTHTHTDPF